MAELVGIMGGTFDPIHFGHLRSALELMQRLGLSQVRFIPNRIPPHRGQPLLDDVTRAELVQQAIMDIPQFVLDSRELKREGPSYMVDTLASLQQDLPHHRLCLIMGMDAYNGFQQWYRWEAILELCHLVVMTRPGASLQEAMQLPGITEDPAQLQQTSAGQILLQCVTPLDISASQIRQCLESGQSTRFLIPEAIREKLEAAYARQCNSGN